MFERFTKKAREVLAEAAAEERRRADGYIGTEHLLLGMLRVDDGIACEVLRAAGLSYEAVRAAVDERVGRPVDGDALASIGIDVDTVRRAVEESFGPGALERALSRRSRQRAHAFTPRAKKVLELALREALAMKLSYIGTEHVLLGIIREHDGAAAEVLRALAPTADLRQAVRERLREAS